MRKTMKYKAICNNVRKIILDLIYRTKSPHIGSSFSCVEILVSLYFKILNISPDDPLNDNRDRFILSKGHACPALYAVLFKKGFLSLDELKGFAVDGGLLEQHPTRDVRKGIEVSTGSLGHGLSIGVGMALAGKIDKKTYRTFVLLSDGELNEGATWEAALFASHHGLDNLVAIVDCNKIQALGFTKDIIDMGPLKKKWTSFGWAVKEVDGHDIGRICRVLSRIPFTERKPSVLIANTIKGKGVSFMENQLLWHYRAPDNEEYQMAIEELAK